MDAGLEVAYLYVEQFITGGWDRFMRWDGMDESIAQDIYWDEIRHLQYLRQCITYYELDCLSSRAEALNVIATNKAISDLRARADQGDPFAEQAIDAMLLCPYNCHPVVWHTQGRRELAYRAPYPCEHSRPQSTGAELGAEAS